MSGGLGTTAADGSTVPLRDAGEWAGVRLGLDDTGDWWVIDAGVAARLRTQPAAGLRLLEVALPTLRGAVEQARESHPFPYAEVVAAALTGGLEHWAMKALDWLTEPRLESESIDKALAQLLSAKWASQDLRHRARQLLRLRCG